jgi:hypothetical protein
MTTATTGAIPSNFDFSALQKQQDDSFNRNLQLNSLTSANAERTNWFSVLSADKAKGMETLAQIASRNINAIQRV